MQQQFFLAIVENRVGDPTKNGRIQVRVFGVHTESMDDVPTESLPWAIVLDQSASISGIGNSGSKYVEGSMVFVFFQDGESKQNPVILGAAPGIPANMSPFGVNGTYSTETIDDSSAIGTDLPAAPIPTPIPVTTSTGTPVVDSSGSPILSGSTDNNKSLKDALGKKESSNNYKAINQLGYIGKYQMGAAMLTDLGYVKKGTRNSDLSKSEFWTGKNGMTSRDAWLNSPTTQETAMDAELAMNENRLTKLGVIDSSSTSQEKAGYLATSHLLGTGGARDMKRGITKKDGNGVTGQVYYKLGYAALSGKEPIVEPDKTTPDNPARETSTNPLVGATIASGGIKSMVTSNLGFKDPNNEYPRYTKEADTNRLARNQNISKTIVSYKEETLDQGVRIAGGGTWDQSQVPYNTIYPYNQVFESESGHILEFDDTPNNERINLHHTSGTFTEIDRNGTSVRKIIGDTYEIWERDGHVHIMGTVNITVDGNANISVGNTCNLEVGGDLNASIGGNANWAVLGDWNVKTGGKEHHSNGGDFAVDATFVNLNSGTSTAGSLATPEFTASGVRELLPLTLEARGFEDLAEFETGDLTPAEAEAHQKDLANRGLIDTNVIPGNVEDKGTNVDDKKVSETPVTCDMFVSGKININEYISTNFKLKDLTKGSAIPSSQSGLKDTELACNLKNLCVNVLEPIKAKYPDMIITSGLRPMGSNAKSQHPLGQAADIQFTTKKSSDYIDIARDLVNLIPVDQLILEYRSNVRKSGGAPTTWIHVSFSSKGNRKQVFSMDNDKRISNFGELKAVT